LVEEVKHIRKGNEHNTSLLNNGLNSSVIMSPDLSELDEDKGAELANYLKKHHQGSNNAGKPLIMPLPMKVIGQAGNNKDMDYIALIDIDETRVYRTFNIPLALVKTQSMTYSNYEASTPYLYTDAILPVYSSIAEGITNGLFDRYPDLKNMVLTYDKFGIPAMESVFIKSMKELAGTGVSLNELRSKGGYSPVENGDKPLITAGLKPYDQEDLYSSYPDGSDSE
jgi:phage portal protein BeeE